MNRKQLTTVIWIALVSGMAFFLLIAPEKNARGLFYSLGTLLLCTVLMAVSNSWINRILTQKYSWVAQTRVRVITGILATLLINVGGILLLNYINFVLIQQMDPGQFLSGRTAVLNWLFINIALLIAAVLNAKSFMEEWRKAASQQVTEQKIIARSANAQFESLKNQLDPHFLFNSLNVLSALIDENPAQAQHFTASMSKVYPYLLDQKDKELVTVEEEPAFSNT